MVELARTMLYGYSKVQIPNVVLSRSQAKVVIYSRDKLTTRTGRYNRVKERTIVVGSPQIPKREWFRLRCRLRCKAATGMAIKATASDPAGRGTSEANPRHQDPFSVPMHVSTAVVAVAPSALGTLCAGQIEYSHWMRWMPAAAFNRY
jgi:hypothetical protein